MSSIIFFSVILISLVILLGAYRSLCEYLPSCWMFGCETSDVGTVGSNDIYRSTASWRTFSCLGPFKKFKQWSSGRIPLFVQTIDLSSAIGFWFSALVLISILAHLDKQSTNKHSNAYMFKYSSWIIATGRQANRSNSIPSDPSKASIGLSVSRFWLFSYPCRRSLRFLMVTRKTN